MEKRVSFQLRVEAVPEPPRSEPMLWNWWLTRLTQLSFPEFLFSVRQAGRVYQALPFRRRSIDMTEKSKSNIHIKPSHVGKFTAW